MRLLRALLVFTLLSCSTRSGATSPPDAPSSRSPAWVEVAQHRVHAARAARAAWYRAVQVQHDRALWYWHVLTTVEEYPDWPEWRALGVCETGLTWTWHQPSYGGAFGIYHGTWRSFGGSDYAPTAGEAPPFLQVIVARRIRDRYGYAAWGCGRKLGL